MDKKLALKLNGGRQVVGILRGFDPFMNLVVDETIEECKDGSKNNIGMVVSVAVAFFDEMVNVDIFKVIRGNSIVMLEALDRV